MAYTKKTGNKTYKRRITKKTYKKVASVKGTKSLVALINKISLKKVETKNTHVISENINLYHNTPFIDYNHLGTTQAITDNDAGVSNVSGRIGDEIILRGLSYKFWFANKLDRPNVMYKIIIYKYQSNTPPAAPFHSQGTTNYMIRDLDTEKYKIVKVVNFNLQNNAQRLISQDVFQGAEGHKKVSIWIPLKNQKCKYENGTSQPRFIDYAYSIVCYDSYGTLTSDNIASYAVNRKLYFKDP